MHPVVMSTLNLEHLKIHGVQKEIDMSYVCYHSRRVKVGDTKLLVDVSHELKNFSITTTIVDTKKKQIRSEWMKSTERLANKTECKRRYKTTTMQ